MQTLPVPCIILTLVTIAEFLSLYKPNSDVCSLPKVVGPCRAAFRSYFYNKKTRRCERFIYGGCGGNKNNFATLQKCKEACDLPFYPSIKPKYPVRCGPVCRIFCPNGNVPDKNGCPTCQCIPDKPNSDVCSLPKVVGPCRAAFRSYFYNKKTGRCERFTYGGCGGNKNKFATLQKCKEACGYSRGKLIRFPM